MGTGVSKSFRLYMLHDWAPEVDVPENLERDARNLARQALRQAELHAPRHRRGLPPSQPRPLWLDPTLLHIAVAGSSQAAVDVALGALSSMAPLAEVVSDREQAAEHKEYSGALGKAMEIGLRCFAFVDPDLRILRIWAVRQALDLSEIALGLSRFDLLLWVQSSALDREEKEEEATRESVAVAVDVDADGAVVVSPGLLVRNWTGQLGKVVEVIDSLSFRVQFSDDESAAVRTIANFKAADGRPLKLPPEIIQDVPQLDLGLLHCNSAETITDLPGLDICPESPLFALSDSEFDAGSALSPGPSPTYVPKPTFCWDSTSTLPNTTIKSSSPLGSESSSATLPGLPVLDCSAETLLREDDLYDVEASGELTARPTNDSSQLVLQVYQELEGEVSVERLQELTQVLANECHTPKAEADEKMRRCGLEEMLQKVRAEKQRASDTEDYDAAHQAKEREKALLAELDKLNVTANLCESTDSAIAGNERRDLEEALQRVQVLKRQAAEDEDYDAAHEAKERENALLAELERLGVGMEPSGLAQKREKLEEELRRARALKQAASKIEDYDAAHEARELEKTLLAELELLSKQRAVQQQGDIRSCRAGTTAVSAAATAEALHSDSVEASRVHGFPRVLQRLAGWTAGRPPLLVIGQRGEVLEAIRQTLPEARIWELPASVFESSSTRGCSLLARIPAFWEVLETGVHTIALSRGFPSPEIAANAKEDDLGSGLQPGSLVRLSRSESAHSGETAVVLGRDKKGYHVRLWDDEVIHVAKVARPKFKVVPPCPVMLTHMDRWIVRLKDLKSKPELNGKEGITEANVADGGRRNVRLTDGTVIAARPANIEVLEYDRPELEGCVGLLDGFEIHDAVRYKVLLVNLRVFGRARIRGLVQKPGLNGKDGIIKSFTVESQRYQVMLSDGGEIAVKRVNLEFLDPQRITAQELSLRPECIDHWLHPDDEEVVPHLSAAIGS